VVQPAVSPGPALRIVTPRYGAAVVGGAERLARMLALSLHGAGWAVEVSTTCARDAATWRNQEPPGRSDDEGVLVRRFPVRMARRPALFAQVSRGFFRLPPGLRPERAWVALQGPWSPALTAALAAPDAAAIPALFLPYLYHPTLVGLPAYPGPRVLMPAAHDELPLRLGMVGRAIEACGALLYGTDEEREIVEAAHPVARDRPSAVGNVGIMAPAQVDAAAFRRQVGLGSDEPYLLYGGRVAPGKGMEELLAGVGELRARTPSARLVLTGEAGTVTPASAAVLPVGQLDEASRWDAIAGAAAVVVPSFHESLSLLALEAWAVGRPVLANGASPVLRGQVLRSGGGIAYRGAAELGLAAADLISDPDVAAALGRAGQRYVAASYRWEAVHQRLSRLIAEASHA
jgi:glycosyltransferase involved in cell wall biosynthesis